MMHWRAGNATGKGGDAMDKKTWDQAHTTKSNKAQDHEQNIAGNPVLKTKGLEFEKIKNDNKKA